MPVNTEQKLSDILLLFLGGNSCLLEGAKGIGKLELGILGNVPSQDWEGSRLQRGLGGVEAKEKAAIGWLVFRVLKSFQV